MKDLTSGSGMALAPHISNSPSIPNRLSFFGKRLARFCSVLVCSVLVPGMLLQVQLSAQTRDLGALKGRVQDSQGAAIAAAEVQLRNAATGFILETKTDAEGNYG